MTDAPRSVRDLDFHPRGDVLPSPADWRDAVFYQLIIDRFDDGLHRPAYHPATAKRGRDPRQGAVFQGGTLKGIARRLDYLNNLGCNALWISPPFKQRQDEPGAYHGYAIQDFLDIDPRFGTTADLQALVREAHRRGIYVVLDIVINHAADVFRYKGDPPYPYKPHGGQYEFSHWHKVTDSPNLERDDAVWPVELQHPDCFKRRGSIRDLATEDEDEKVNGDFFSFKEFNLAHPDVMNALVSAYKYWIAVADVDGYRIDTLRNVEPNACAKFCNAVREYASRIGKHNFFLMGEVVGDDRLLRKYVGDNTPPENERVRHPLLDAVLDFPLYAELDEIVKGERAPGPLWKRYYEFRKYYRTFALAGRYYVTFIDNHDQTCRPWRRFLHRTGGDARLGVLGVGAVLTTMGIPCIYSGTEQGFDGGGDSDVYIREAMFGGNWGAFDTTGVHFFDESHPIYQGVARVAKVRESEPALRYGRQYFRAISGDGEHFGTPTAGKATLAYSRVLDTDEVLVALNLDTQLRSDWVLVDPALSPPGTRLRDLLDPAKAYTVESTPGGAAVRLPLEARAMAILKKSEV